MYGFKIPSLFALAVAVPHVLAAPPACLFACVARVQQQSSCSSLSDLSCLCSAEYNNIASCLDLICPNGNADAAKNALTDSCGSRPRPSSSSASASRSSSGSTSQSSAASSGTSSSGTNRPLSTSSAAPTPRLSSGSGSASSTGSGSSTARPTFLPTFSLNAGANDVGKAFGAVAVIGLVGALL